MEVTQFTYFQQVGGFDCKPVSGELTYGLERLAMYVQGVDNVYDLDFNGAGVTYGDVFLQTEREYRRTTSRSPTPSAVRPLRRCRGRVQGAARERRRRASPLPAYEQAIKASHLFNLLDARGVISVAERQAYIGRVRALAKAACAAGCKRAATWRRPWPSCCSSCCRRRSRRACSRRAGDLGSLRRRARGRRAAVRQGRDLRHPRRLTLVMRGLAAKQADVEVERRGPRVGAPQAALDGFLGALGTTDYRLEEQDDRRGRVHVARSSCGSVGPPAEVLAQWWLGEILARFPWPKSMRWGAHEVRWVRP